MHAAALASLADIVLTSDNGFLHLGTRLKDRLPYEIYGPDDFFTLVDDQQPWIVRAVMAKQITHAATQGRSPSLGESLVRAGCPTFARRIRAHLAAP